MALSESEERALREIEADLLAHDRSLAARLSSARPSQRGLWRAVGMGLVGLIALAIGLVLGDGAGDGVALVGYLLIVGSTTCLITIACDR